MQITLNQDEIEQAIIAHVKSCINVADGTTIAVDLKAGRGDNGFSATLDIIPAALAASAMPASAAVKIEPKVATHIAARIQEDAAQAAETALTANSVDDSAAAKPVTKVGLFTKPAVDTTVVDELVNEDPTPSADDEELEAEEVTAKPTAKSIFSKVS